MNDQIRELSESGEENEKRLRDAEKAKMKLETTVLEKDVDIKHLTEQLKDLKSLLQRGGDGDVVGDDQFPIKEGGDLASMSSNSKDIVFLTISSSSSSFLYILLFASLLLLCI